MWRFQFRRSDMQIIAENFLVYFFSEYSWQLHRKIAIYKNISTWIHDIYPNTSNSLLNILNNSTYATLSGSQLRQLNSLTSADILLSDEVVVLLIKVLLVREVRRNEILCLILTHYIGYHKN
ncbi:hypothetical protein H8356DRAFT_1356110 [Neocallimastix lanati (nom. inval.)]|nr:hypothetical protein H8356DRAFT_1356110 [Neocallimastix sp. JGI-2020a]